MRFHLNVTAIVATVAVASQVLAADPGARTNEVLPFKIGIEFTAEGIVQRSRVMHGRSGMIQDQIPRSAALFHRVRYHKTWATRNRGNIALESSSVATESS